MIAFVLISFIFEGIVSNLVNVNSIFLPLFTITSLLIVYPYFNKEKKIIFIIFSAIIGIFYDIVYTDSLFINTFTFSICSLLIIFLENYLSYSFISSIGLNILIILLFKIISYILFFLFGFIRFNTNIFIQGLYSSLILNIIYGIILYIICDKLRNKFNIRKYK